MNVYHITPLNNWRKALEYGAYSADSLEKDGFIHCCTKDQTEGVLEIDPTLLSTEIKYEDSHGSGELFPHVYGPLNLDAVVAVTFCAER